MELLIEAISDLKSACFVPHDASYTLLPQLIRSQISGAEGRLAKPIPVRVLIFDH